MSIYMLDRSLILAGALLAETIAHFIGGRATTGTMGCVVLFLAVLFEWSVPVLRTMRI
jgi:hypothetical protein